MLSRILGSVRVPSLSGGLKLVALLIGIGIPAFVAHTIHQEREQDLRAAEVKAVNTTRALEQHAARTLETIDAYLQAVISLIGHDLSRLPPEVIHRALRDRLTYHLHNIVIIDSQGDLVHEGAAFPLRPRERRARDYFEVLRQDPKAGLFVGAPIIGGASGKPTLPIARRINKPDGSFAGVIMAALDPAAFQSVYDAIDLGADATLTLWRSDGMVLVRAPHVGALIGKSFGTSENYRRYVVPKDAKPFWAAGSTDGITRVISYGFPSGHPLYVSTALSRDTVLEAWKRSAITQASVAGVLTVLVVSSLIFAARQVKRRQLALVAVRDAARETEATNFLLQTTLDTMDQGLIMVDEEGVVQVHNRRALELLDLPAELMEARPTFAQVRQYQLARQDFERSDQTLRQWVETSGIESAHHVYERERPNGTILEIRTVPLPNGGAVRTYTDVTDRRLAGRAVRESEARYRLLAENTSDIIMLKSPGGERSYVSPACLTMLGYTTDEFLIIPTPEIVHPDDLDRVMKLYSSIGRETPRATSLHRLRHKQGHWVWVEIVFTLVEREGQVSILGAIRNVEERQRQGDELRLAKDMMEVLLVEAQHASRAKTDFLASMSHEIRTPLNSILGFTGLLLESPHHAPEDRRKLELIQGSGAALLTVVNDILDFSKIEAEQVELDPRSFSLAALIDNGVSILRGVAVHKPVEIRASIDPNLPSHLVGDADRLRQILLNLMNNAVKFTSRGFVEVRAVREEAIGEGVRLRVSVTDTGIGIPQDKLSGLFQRFTQVDGSISRRFGGTGLGLAISKSLVELMGGTISVESTEGRGSTFAFTVTLPIGAGAETPEALEAGQRAMTKPASAARILLAEDLDINQELARLILEREGHTVDIANDGAEALQAVQRVPYDLVLMDVQMPVMDGIEATRRIRSLSGPERDIPIIALTANVLPDQVTRFQVAGMNDHVGKPFRPDELRAALARWLPQAEAPGLIPSAAESGQDIIDRAVLDEMVEVLGEAKIASLLGQLEAHITDVLQPLLVDHVDRGRLAAGAHATVSAAGMLGFQDLSDRCARLEQACHAGGAVAELVAQVRGSSEGSLGALRTLRSPLQTAA